MEIEVQRLRKEVMERIQKIEKKLDDFIRLNKEVDTVPEEENNEEIPF
jgi:hypothetical protein